MRLGHYPEHNPARRSCLERICGTAAGLISRCNPFQRLPLQRFLQQANALGNTLQHESDRELKERISMLRRQLHCGGLVMPHTAMAFALVREAARRTIGLSHYDVQLMGGWAMLHGRIAEMETGEGKTLAATLPAATAALAGIPVHVITVNDYLVKRDAEQMQPVFNWLGLSVGHVTGKTDAEARRKAYACDITYCSNKQLAFDYLHDRIMMRNAPGKLAREVAGLHAQDTGADRLLLRGLCFAIVDEADSVLIDEAGTPLVISRPSTGTENASRARVYRQALALAGDLAPGRDYVLDPLDRRVTLTAAGRLALASMVTESGDDWRLERRRDEWVTQALAATHLYHRDREYLVQDGQVRIIDDHTGRVMADRNWSRGLHQMIEVKEGCDISTATETLARISYQRFFSRYLRLSGMTGTATEAATELHASYGLQVLRIPTHRPSRLTPGVDRIHPATAEKWMAVARRARELHRQGRPVLIGTRSVEDSEHISRLLTAQQLEHQVLNARQDSGEAELVRHAGHAGRITVATNMAGRGTDIPLAPGVAAADGLHVIAVERNATRQVDRQLFGRCARQGDPGSFESILSLEDELPTRYLSKRFQRLAVMWLSRPTPATRWMCLALLRYCQARSEKMQRAQRRELEKMEEYLGTVLAFTGRTD